MNLIPAITNNNELIDGQYIKVLPFCKSNYGSSKCAKFYKSLAEKKISGFYTCPYGLSCYVMVTEGQANRVYIGFRERKTYDKTLAKTPNHTAEKTYNPVLQEEQILSLINASAQLDEIEYTLEEKAAAIESISHEAKKLNSQIKERSDLILQSYRLNDDDVVLSTEELHKLRADIRTIFVSSSMVASRFSLFDYEKNPDALSQGVAFDCNVYKKFNKIQRIFYNYMKKGIIVNITGSSYEHITAYPSFELIPLLLIENAIKYSYTGYSVDINFTKTIANGLEVTIDSFSPYCSQDELGQIFLKGYRGKHAKKVSSDGSGIGLYFVKMICDLHSVKISATSNNSRIVNINSIPYAPFQIKLEFPETYRV